MTVLATIFGFLVFIVSCFTVGFKSAVKRLLMFMGIGVLCDLAILFIAYAVTVGF